MRAWKSLKVGDKVSVREDGKIIHCIVTAVSAGRAIATFDGENYWIDDDTREMFGRGWV